MSEVSEVSEVSEIVKKCFTNINSVDTGEYEKREVILKTWLMKDKTVDLYRVCELIVYIKENTCGIISYFKNMLVGIGLGFSNAIHRLPYFYKLFNNDVVEFYKGKYCINQELCYSKLLKKYAKHIGLDKQVLNYGLSHILSYYNIESVQQINFIMGITSGETGDDVIKYDEYSKLFITTKKLGYDETVILNKFGITKEQYDIMATQEYYEYVVKYGAKDTIERYLLDKPEKEFNIAALCFVEVIRTSMEDLKESHVTIPATLVERLIEMAKKLGESGEPGKSDKE